MYKTESYCVGCHRIDCVFKKQSHYVFYCPEYLSQKQYLERKYKKIWQDVTMSPVVQVMAFVAYYFYAGEKQIETVCHFIMSLCR